LSQENHYLPDEKNNTTTASIEAKSGNKTVKNNKNSVSTIVMRKIHFFECALKELLKKVACGLADGYTLKLGK
tara:strand:- start:2288 stop:2506 length:219 start_codon:yes stop_codon:yes gene_type:complete